LFSPVEEERGKTPVFRGPSAKLAKRAALLLAIACAAGALASTPRAALDLAVRRDSGHALLRLGFASISIAFDFGQRCSKSNGCGAVMQ
jgi:hypothetical protein